jgi:hypothetical protein
MYSPPPDFTIDPARHAAMNKLIDEQQAVQSSYEQEQTAALQKKQAEAAKIKANTDPKSGRPKDSRETLAPSQFGIKENLQDFGAAVLGGVADTVNDVTGVVKVADPKFYQPGNTDYKPPFAQIEAPIARTKFGKVIQAVVNFGTLAVVTRGAAGRAGGLVSKLGPVGQVAAKGLKYVGGAEKTTRLGRVGQAAVQGAIVDTISNRSMQSNLARDLIDMNPSWEDSLTKFATNDEMSPAQRAMYNIFEGGAMGVALDLAAEGISAGVKSVRETAGKATAQVTDPELSKLWKDRTGDSYRQAQEMAERNKTAQVETLTRNAIMQKEFTALKRNGEVHPEMTFKDYKATNPKSAWNGLDDETKAKWMQTEADKKGLVWSPSSKTTARQTYQDDVTATRATDAINRNPEAYQVQPEGVPAATRSFDVIEGDVTQGANSSRTNNIFNGVVDQNRIAKEWGQAEGAPRGGFTDAQTGRVAYGAPGQSLEEIKASGQQLAADPRYQAAEASLRDKSGKDLSMADVTERLESFFATRGMKGVQDISPDDLRVDNAELFGEGFTTFNSGTAKEIRVANSQIGAKTLDVLIGQGLTTVRDNARLAAAVGDEIDILEQDGIGRTLKENIMSMFIMRKEIGYMASRNLSGLKGDLSGIELDELAEATSNAKGLVNDVFDVLGKDTDDNLLNAYIDALGKSDNFANMQDLHSYLSKNLMGYSEGDFVRRNAVLGQLNNTMINSFLSGPRTVAKATFGTGFNAFLRPISTIVGASGSAIRGQDQTLRSAMYDLGGMIDSLGEGWQLARKAWNSSLGAELPSSPASAAMRAMENESDAQWAMQGAFFKAHGSDGEKAVWLAANQLRELNKNPFFNWAGRAMEAGDQAWRYVIARGRLKSMAFNEAYEMLRDAGKATDDETIQKLLPEISDSFQNKIWKADGELADPIAKMAGDEVTMTKELIGVGKKLDEAFKSNAFLRPFMLFARTSWNSLELTAKHTPLLNNILTEVQDIKNLDINSVEGAQILSSRYGITNATDHATAKALIAGREAIGFSTVALAATAFMNGTITGNGPFDRELRDTMIQSGWRPRSIKIGDKYVSYDSLEPLNTFMSFVADVGDASLEMGEKWTEEQFGRLAYVFIQNVTNKSFMTGLTQLTDVLQMKGNRPAMVLGGIANGLIPLSGARNEMGRIVAPGMRELNAGFMDSVRNRNLWSDVVSADGSKLPYKYDVLNGTKINDYDFMTRAFNAVSPFQINMGTTPTRDLLFRSLYDVKVSVNTGPMGEKLDASMKSKYQYLIGQQNVEAQLTELFQNPAIAASIMEMEADRAAGRRYDAMTTLHNDQIKQVFDAAKQTAWAQLMADDDGVGQVARDLALTKQANTARKGGDTDRAKEILQMRNR